MTWLLLATTDITLADDGWKRPPEPVEQVLLAPPPPLTVPDPTGRKLLLLVPVEYPPIADLAVAFLQLAGTRLDPRNGAAWGAQVFESPALVDVGTGAATPLPLPADSRVLDWEFSADGRRLALVVREPDAVRLVVSVDGKAPKEVERLGLNVTLGSTLAFLPDQRTLLVRAATVETAAHLQPPVVPAGPIVAESSGSGAASTYEARDLLKTASDDAVFTSWATSRVTLVDTDALSVRPVGPEGVYGGVSASPDGKWLLVEHLRTPWSHRTTWDNFATDVEVWTLGGQLAKVVASNPAAEAIPIHGVPEGPREVHWRQNATAALAWTEALDGGDPKREVAHRDRLMGLAAPFEEAPVELFRAKHRLDSVRYGENGLAVVEQWEREKRWRHVWTLDTRFGAASAKPWFDLSVNDRYADPGRPLVETDPQGRRLLRRDGEDLWFVGAGASPEGDRPFLDRRRLGATQSIRVFRSAPDRYEQFLGFAQDDPARLLVRTESESSPPAVVVATLKGKVRAAAGEPTLGRTDAPLVGTPDPTPQLREVKHRIVTYTRKDGVPLSFHLYLPPGYVEGSGPLPTVLYAYPREYSDPATAGQIVGSNHTFLRLRGASHLFYLLQGYAVLDQTAMPVLGDPDTAYDTFVEQIVMDAEAAIAKAVELGVTDRERVGVIGHSHGGLMVATLVAHSELFQAGIARSGAYNHTIRPFGYQSERRTLWEARDSYLGMSPVFFAPQVKTPLMLIHGAADQNPGTIPFQSERLFDAVRGTGGTARLVMLPYEGHAYLARESVEHVLAEQLEWFDRYVKGEPAP